MLMQSTQLKSKCTTNAGVLTALCQHQSNHEIMHKSYKNSSGDKITNVNFLTTISHTRRLGLLKSTEKNKPTSFNKLDDK